MAFSTNSWIRGELLPLYELTDAAITALGQTTFGGQGISERYDLQRLLKQNIEVIAPKTRIIDEEFCEWEDSRRRIDLLGIDQEANLGDLGQVCVQRSAYGLDSQSLCQYA